jgi:hypothetical protein
MSQEYNAPSRKPRRTRSQRNRPTLVTDQNSTLSPDEEVQTSSEVATQVEEQETAASEVAQPVSKPRRLPGFFSTVGKEEKEDEKKEVVQARLARATRRKLFSFGRKSSEQTEDEAPVKKESRPATPATSTSRSGFKSRHFIGIAIYLFTAQFIGYGEAVLLTSLGWEGVLIPPFNLFGNPITIRTSTVAFLATLVILLVVLARLDLIPRSLAGMPSSRTGQTHSRQPSSSDSRPTQPAVRQGVKGEDDDLYQAYRARQRRDKKR